MATFLASHTSAAEAIRSNAKNSEGKPYMFKNLFGNFGVKPVAQYTTRTYKRATQEAMTEGI